MIFVYTSILISIFAIRWYVNRKAKSTEAKFSEIAKEKEEVFNHLSNATKTSFGSFPLLLEVTRFSRLTKLVEKCDKAEEVATKWADRGETLDRWYSGIKNFKGKALPYTFGLCDVASIFYILDSMGLSVSNFINLQLVIDLVARVLVEMKWM
jgi:hypothetical protein